MIFHGFSEVDKPVAVAPGDLVEVESEARCREMGAESPDGICRCRKCLELISFLLTWGDHCFEVYLSGDTPSYSLQARLQRAGGTWAKTQLRCLEKFLLDICYVSFQDYPLGM